jgi:site-specific DNA-methyltransferase (adenine-specific)
MINGSNTPKGERDEARTPGWLFKWLNYDWGFDVDLAASDENHKCKSYFTKSDNALSINWFSREASPMRLCGFCNPPYSDIGSWFKKAADESRLGFTSVFVVPTPNGESYYKIVEESASELILIHGRIAFERPDGTYMTGNPRGTCIVVFGPSGGPPKLSWVDRDAIKKGESI